MNNQNMIKTVVSARNDGALNERLLQVINATLDSQRAFNDAKRAADLMSQLVTSYISGEAPRSSTKVTSGERGLKCLSHCDKPMAAVISAVSSGDTAAASSFYWAFDQVSRAFAKAAYRLENETLTASDAYDLGESEPYPGSDEFKELNLAFFTEGETDYKDSFIRFSKILEVLRILTFPFAQGGSKETYALARFWANDGSYRYQLCNTWDDVESALRPSNQLELSEGETPTIDTSMFL